MACSRTAILDILKFAGYKAEPERHLLDASADADILEEMFCNLLNGIDSRKSAASHELNSRSFAKGEGGEWAVNFLCHEVRRSMG